MTTNPFRGTWRIVSSGRGFAEIAHGELLGHIYIHLGDNSAFRAVKQK